MNTKIRQKLLIKWTKIYQNK